MIIRTFILFNAVSAFTIPEISQRSFGLFAPQREMLSTVKTTLLSRHMADADESAEGEATMAKDVALVPINQNTVEFTSGLIGGVAGLAIGGPVLGLLSAAFANYITRKSQDSSDDDDDKFGDIVQSVSVTSIMTYNYLAKLTSKYSVLEKAKSSLENSISQLKASGSGNTDAITKAESALDNVVSKMNEFDNQFDFINGISLALQSVGDVVERSVDTIVELNEEYDITGRIVSTTTDAIEKGSKSVSNVAATAASAATDVSTAETTTASAPVVETEAKDEEAAAAKEAEEEAAAAAKKAEEEEAAAAAAAAKLKAEEEKAAEEEEEAARVAKESAEEQLRAAIEEAKEGIAKANSVAEEGDDDKYVDKSTREEILKARLNSMKE